MFHYEHRKFLISLPGLYLDFLGCTIKRSPLIYLFVKKIWVITGNLHESIFSLESNFYFSTEKCFFSMVLDNFHILFMT